MKASMNTVFKLKWGDELEYGKWTKFLGKEWRRGDQCVRVSIPTKYYDEILTEHRLNNCKATCVPCQPTTASKDTSEKLSPEKQHAYRRDIGKLMWVLPERPDLSFVVRDLARR
eukprot:16439623-Heterocapsa_arctica.AAC.1